MYSYRTPIMSKSHREKSNFYVYKIENLCNHKLYIGITSKELGTRFLEHIGNATRGNKDCIKLYNAMRKYGIGNFLCVKIDECSTWSEVCEKERYYISLFKTQRFGYNVSSGGDGLLGYKWTKTQRARVSKSFGDTQTCVTCNVNKSISEFSTRNHAHRGDFTRRPIAECKACVSRRSSSYAKINREKINLWKRKDRHSKGISNNYSSKYKTEGAI